MNNKRLYIKIENEDGCMESKSFKSNGLKDTKQYIKELSKIRDMLGRAAEDSTVIMDREEISKKVATVMIEEKIQSAENKPNEVSGEERNKNTFKGVGVIMASFVGFCSIVEGSNHPASDSGVIMSGVNDAMSVIGHSIVSGVDYAMTIAGQGLDAASSSLNGIASSNILDGVDALSSVISSVSPDSVSMLAVTSSIVLAAAYSCYNGIKEDGTKIDLEGVKLSISQIVPASMIKDDELIPTNLINTSAGEDIMNKEEPAASMSM